MTTTCAPLCVCLCVYTFVSACMFVADNRSLDYARHLYVYGYILLRLREELIRRCWFFQCDQHDHRYDCSLFFSSTSSLRTPNRSSDRRTDVGERSICGNGDLPVRFVQITTGKVLRKDRRRFRKSERPGFEESTRLL